MKKVNNPLSLVQRIQKPSQPSHVLCKLSRPFGNIVVAPIGDPPRISFQVIGSRLVHAHSLGDGNLLVQPAVYNHDGAFGFSDPINVGVNVETGEGPVLYSDAMQCDEIECAREIMSEKARKTAALLLEKHKNCS